MELLEKYRNYQDSDEEFSYCLRMFFEWDDEKYQEKLSMIRSIFHSYQNEQVIPKDIVHFFTGEIDFIVGTVSKDVFFTTSPEGLTIKEYKRIVLERKSELLELKKMFFAGDFYNLSSHSFFV